MQLTTENCKIRKYKICARLATGRYSSQASSIRCLASEAPTNFWETCAAIDLVTANTSISSESSKRLPYIGHASYDDPPQCISKGFLLIYN